MDVDEKVVLPNDVSNLLFYCSLLELLVVSYQGQLNSYHIK